MIYLLCASVPENFDADQAVDSLLSLIGRSNSEYFDEIKGRKNAPESLCAYLLLAKALSNFNCGDSLILSRSELGKPRFDGSNISFSISHSERLAVCAVSDEGGVGVDIEAKEISPEKAVKLAKRYFNDDEITTVEANPEKFARIWTKKEAKAKFFGSSLSKILEEDKICQDTSEIACHSFEYKGAPISLFTQEKFGDVKLIVTE